VSLLVAVLAGGLCYGLYSLVMKGYLRLHYPSHISYQCKGIDVSHHQGDVDWIKVADAGIQFVFIKVSEGGDHRDTRYLQNVDGAINNGISLGMYHYYSFCKSAEMQFQNFFSALPKGVPILPPVIDVEFDQNCNARTQQDFLIELERLVGLIHQEIGVYPILYCNENMYNQFLVYLTHAEKIPFWVRDLYAVPHLENNKQWSFWQHSSRGSVSGIKGNVDLNVFQGSSENLEEMKVIL